MKLAPMSAEQLRTAIEAAVYTPDSVNQITMGAFQCLFGRPNPAQWASLFDFYAVSQRGRLIALGQDKANVGRIPRDSRPTVQILAQYAR